MHTNSKFAASRFSVAPMMNWTDRHFRYLFRLISRHVLLYTEMVTADAVIHGDKKHLLAFNPEEHPVALQLGGSDPAKLAIAAKVGADYGYDEINLNVGCPSDRVQAGKFGACLMKEPTLVADCVAAMQAAVSVPVTVKCRLGVDDQEDYQALHHFIQTVAQLGCQTFIVHARKAWLQGLSPKQNREVPPLRYDLVHQLKQDFPSLTLIINGGIQTIAEAKKQLQYMDGVMLGRQAYQRPYSFVTLDSELFNDQSKMPPSRLDILSQYADYMCYQMGLGVPASALTWHVYGILTDFSGAKQWRRWLTDDPGRLLRISNYYVAEA